MKKKFIIQKPILLLLISAFGILLTSYVSNAQEHNSKANTGHAFLWSNIQETGYKREATEKRSRYTKHFELYDGSFKMYTSPGSIHYQTNTGWQEIDLGIHANNTGIHATNPYYNGDNSFKSYYPPNPISSHVYTHVKDGDMAESILGMYAVDQNWNTVYQYQSSTPLVTVKQNSITYANLFPNTDVSYSQQVDGRKMGVILQSAQALSGLPAIAKFIVIKEKIIIPADWTVNENEGYINLFAGKIWVANILKPTAIEKQNADKIYLSDEDFMTEGTIRMTRNGNELTLYTTFSIDWLKQSNRQFPVNLDPTTNFYPPIPVIPTAPSTSFATGRLTSATGNKNAGFLRVASTNTFAWAKFFIPNSGSGSMAGASISSATYWGYNYSPTGTVPDKITTVVGMQTVDPETTVNNATTPIISTQINTTGPVYNNSYIFGSTIPAGCTSPSSVCVWRSAVLTSNAISDIASQIVSQAWTAFGIKYTSGNTTTSLQAGIEVTTSAPTSLPYLALVYTTGCTGTPNPGNTMANLTAICPNTQVNFSLQNPINGTSFGYQWYNNSGPISGATNNTYTGIVYPPNTFYCMVTCMSSGLSASSLPIVINANSIYNSSTLSMCNSFTWNGTTYTNNGVYTQTFNSASGCDSVVTLNLTINTINTTVAQSGFSLWSNTAGAQYQWINCTNNTPIAGATNQGYTTTVGGTYGVVITQFGCTDTSDCVTIFSVNTVESLLSNLIELSPNPAKDELNIQYLTNHSFKRVVLQAYNVVGEQVYEIVLPEDKKKVSIDIRSWLSGQYYIKLIADNEVIGVKKLSVLR